MSGKRITQILPSFTPVRVHGILIAQWFREKATFKATKPKKRKSEPPPAPDLDKMVAACMADVSDDNDDDLDDQDDDDLLNELAEFEDDDDNDNEEDLIEKPTPNVKPTPQFVEPIAPSTNESASCVPNQCAGESLLSVIETRLEMYALAEKKAKETGETSRVRRFARGLTTLSDLRRKVKVSIF